MNQERLAPWIPDDDDDDDEGLENARADIESSDESSDEDEYIIPVTVTVSTI